MEYKVARSRKLRTIPMGRRIERALSRESNVPVLFGISSSIFQTVIRVKRCWGEEEIFFLDLWICSACLCPLYLASSWGLVGRARFPPARSNLSSLLTAFAGRPVPQSLDLLEFRALHLLLFSAPERVERKRNHDSWTWRVCPRACSIWRWPPSASGWPRDHSGDMADKSRIDVNSKTEGERRAAKPEMRDVKSPLIPTLHAPSRRALIENSAWLASLIWKK